MAVASTTSSTAPLVMGIGNDGNGLLPGGGAPAGATPTSWIPLTTSSSIPEACFTAIYSQPGGGRFIAFNPSFTLVDPAFTTSCWPPQASRWFYQEQGTISTVTSLGPFSCPGGYVEGYTTVVSESITNIGCCPSGYFLNLLPGSGNSLYPPGYYGQCYSWVPLSSTFSYYATTGLDTYARTSTVVTASDDLRIFALHINGYNIPIPSSTPSASATASSVSQTGTLSNVTAPAASSGLSSGAKAGIGVGVTLGVIIFASMIFFFLHRRRHLHSAVPGDIPYDNEEKTDGPKIPELSTAAVAELDARKLAELEEERMAELSEGAARRAELDTPGDQEFQSHELYEIGGTEVPRPPQ